MLAKKIILYVLIAVGILLIGFAIFLNFSDTLETGAKVELTAEGICNKIKEKNSNVGTIVIYTEETDLNSLLGRPGQYTSKVTFEDTRLQQKEDNEFLTEEEKNEPVGGTIEVFANKSDMTKRKEYLEQVTSSMSVFAEYSYSKGTVLLRINKELTPTQAQEYEEILKEIVK